MADENEGEEEVRVDVEETEADADLGVLGHVPLIGEEGESEGEEKGAGAAAEAAEPEAEADPDEELETEESKAAKKLRAAYLKRVKAFYKERNRYFQGKRNKTVAAAADFRMSFRLGIQDSPEAQINGDGVLILKAVKGKDVIKVIDEITIPYYSEPDAARLEALEKQRLSKIKRAEEAFEAARDVLRDLKSTGGSTADIKGAMAEIQNADVMLQTARFAQTQLTYYSGVPLALLTMDKYDNGKVDAGAFEGRPITLQERYAVEGAEGGPLGEGAEADEAEGSGVSEVILVSFAEGDHDFLSSWFMYSFEYNGETYCCAFQAIMAEMARKYENDEEVARIMETSDPQEMILQWDTFENKEDDEPITEKKWNKRLQKCIIKVNQAKFSNKKLAKRLAATGSMPIGYIPPENPTDQYQGTGLPFDDPNAYQPRKWPGSNVYGQVLEQIRTEAIGVLKARKTATAAKVPAPKATVTVPVPAPAPKATVSKPTATTVPVPKPAAVPTVAAATVPAVPVKVPLNIGTFAPGKFPGVIKRAAVSNIVPVATPADLEEV
jgi:ribA/ribD-fused uncharacterized protein